MATIAFLGLGHMGLPMALNLSRAGHEVLGFDVVPAATDAARAAGLTVTDSSVEAAERLPHRLAAVDDHRGALRRSMPTAAHGVRIGVVVESII